MKQATVRYLIAMLLGCILCTQSSQAQNPDIDFVQAVNPKGEKAFVFRGLSASVYPVSVAIPIGTFVYGAYKKDNNIRIRAYEEIGSVAIAGVAAITLKETIDR